jgi:NAD(P)H-hydrate repair Nnr-like enzyme with NAD(P)H-hydrate epimerase domain
LPFENRGESVSKTIKTLEGFNAGKRASKYSVYSDSLANVIVDAIAQLKAAEAVSDSLSGLINAINHGGATVLHIDGAIDALVEYRK